MENSFLYFLSLICFCWTHSLPVAEQERLQRRVGMPIQHAHPADIGMYRCMQERIQCFQPLNFLQDALMRMDFTAVDSSQLVNFCRTDLENLKKCYGEVECSIPVPSMDRAIAMIDWMCDTTEGFNESLPCFKSEAFNNNTSTCKTRTRAGCKSFCPYPYGRLAACLEPYLLEDENCTPASVSYVSLYMNQLDVPLRRTN